MISSPNSDTITLCGRRNGLSLSLSDYKNNLTITFKTVNKSSGPGFSCQLTLNDQEEEAENEITEAFKGKDLSFRYSVVNSQCCNLISSTKSKISICKIDKRK